MKNSVAILVMLFGALSITPSSIATVVKVPADQPSIQGGINAASDGDTVLVAPGTYRENVDFRGRAVEVVSEAGARYTFITPPLDNRLTIRVTDVTSGPAVLRGFTLYGGRYSSTVLLTNCSATIEGNIFRDNIPADGLNIEVISCAYTSSTIRHNVFYDNGGIACIGLRNGTSGTSVINNTFDRNNRGIYTIALGATVINNIITNSVAYGVAVSDPVFKFDLFANNNIWNNHPNYAYYAVVGAGDISADPMHIDPSDGDYRLLDNSPCLDAGYPDPAYNDPDGTVSDIGAYYFHQDPSSCCVDVRGNVDGDPNEIISMLDLHYLIEYMFKDGPEPPCLEEADVNGDGEINARDLSCIARVMYSHGNPDQLADCPEVK